jgi:hypothetical protein
MATEIPTGFPGTAMKCLVKPMCFSLGTNLRPLSGYGYEATWR